MAFNAKTNSMTLGATTIIDGQHPAIIKNREIAASQGILPRGLVLASSSAGGDVPYNKGFTQNIGTGAAEGATKAFSGTLPNGPIGPSSVSVSDSGSPAQVLTDDGNGNLTGAGTGQINYATGAISVSFTAGPASGNAVVVTYGNQPMGVLTAAVDTSNETVGAALRHGTVVWENVVVGATTPAAPSAGDIAKLNAIGIF